MNPCLAWLISLYKGRLLLRNQGAQAGRVVLTQANMVASEVYTVNSVDVPSKSPEKGPIEFTVAEAKSVRGPKLSKRTDYTRWRLLDEEGRQTWHYLEDDEDVKEWPQSIADKYFLDLPTVRHAHQNARSMLT